MNLTSRNKYHPFLTLSTLFLLMAIYMVLGQPLEKAVAFSVIDDGMYYPKIAENISLLGKVTYDGVTLTNGVHPLWLIILTPIYLFIHNKDLAINVIFYIMTIFCLIAIWYHYKISLNIKLTSLGYFISGFIIFINFRSYTLLFSMLESPLVLLIYLYIIYFIYKVGMKRYESKSYAFILGLLIGLAFLARTDSFLLYPGYFLALTTYFVRNKKGFGKYLRIVLYSLLGTLTLAFPFILFNYVVFGHVNTVSSWMKLTIPNLNTLLIPFDRFYYLFVSRIVYTLGIPEKNKIYILLLILLIVSLLIIILIKNKNKLLTVYSKSPDFFYFVIMHFLFVLIFVPNEALFSIWFYIPEIIAIGITIGRIVPDFNHKVLKIISYSFLGFLILFQFYFYEGFVNKKKMTWAKLEMANYIKENIKGKFLGAMYDSGIVSYFSQKNFIPLNGLIGDFKLAKLCKEGQYSQLAKKYGISHIVWDVPNYLMKEIPGKIIYRTKISTLFNDFTEGEKSFYLIKINSDSLDNFLKLRYSTK